MSVRRVVLPLCLLQALSCSWRDDLDGQRRTPEGLEEQRGQPDKPRNSQDVAIDLFASRPLIAGHRRGSLVIDAGTADFVKYVDGGMRGDWQRGVGIDGPDGEMRAVSLVRGLAAELYFPVDQDPGGVELSGGELQLRFVAKSAVEKQLVSVFLNENKLTDLSMPSADWETYSVRAPADALVQGENKLRFYFRSTGDLQGHRSAAAFSRITVGASLSEESAFASGIHEFSGVRIPGLKVDAPGRLSYYLTLPRQPCALQFRAAGSAVASVRIRTERQASSKTVWTDQTSESWQEHRVDLSPYQGQVVRLDLHSEGAVAWAQARITRQARESAQQERPVPDHIILWSVSSLRSDRLTMSVGRSFRRFAEQGFFVPQVHAAAPAAAAAQASAMTGKFYMHSKIAEERQTLAESLQAAGYATALISGNGFVNDAAGFAQGYGFYDNPMRRHHHFGARTLWRQAKRFLLRHRGERSFVHIATVEPHIPYRPSEESLAVEWSAAKPFSGAKTLSLAAQIANGRQVRALEQSYVRALYDATVADAGAAFSSMLQELEALPLEGQTAIILAGDHGEELWERGAFGHGGSLFQESLLTPLVISSPGLSQAQAPRRASSIDLLPTVLDLAGLAEPPGVQGESLLRPASESRPLFSGTTDGSRAVRLNRYKLIEKAGGELALYDLKADPGEQDNLVLQRPVVARALRVSMATFLAYESAWSKARWGLPTSPSEAFARDQGM